MNKDTALCFDSNLNIKIKNGFAFGIKLIPIFRVFPTATIKLNQSKMYIDNLHHALSYYDKAITRRTGKSHEYEVVGDFIPCEAFSIGKVRMKIIIKNWK
jgi:hypothetical protein